MTINNLIVNGGFETGTLAGWSAINVQVTAEYAHTGNYSAQLAYGAGQASLSQTVPITPGKNFQLLVSLSKFGFNRSPIIILQVLYLNADGVIVGTGLDIEMPFGGIPDVTNGAWREVFQITDQSPANATQARILIIKPNCAINAPMVFIDDVALLEFLDDGTPGATGLTGATGP